MRANISPRSLLAIGLFMAAPLLSFPLNPLVGLLFPQKPWWDKSIYFLFLLATAAILSVALSLLRSRAAFVIIALIYVVLSVLGIAKGYRSVFEERLVYWIAAAAGLFSAVVAIFSARADSRSHTSAPTPSAHSTESTREPPGGAA